MNFSRLEVKRFRSCRSTGRRDGGRRPCGREREAAVTGKALRTADLTEKRAFYEAYGLLAGKDGVARLSAIGLGQGLLKRKTDPETRACAAMALGKTKSADARAALEKLVRSKEPIVRNAAEKALKELP